MHAHDPHARSRTRQARRSRLASHTTQASASASLETRTQGAGAALVNDKGNHMTDAAKFQNALRIMNSLDEIETVPPPHKRGYFHANPMLASIRMDAETWAKVYALIEARQ